MTAMRSEGTPYRRNTSGDLFVDGDEPREPAKYEPADRCWRGILCRLGHRIRTGVKRQDALALGKESAGKREREHACRHPTADMEVQDVELEPRQQPEQASGGTRVIDAGFLYGVAGLRCGDDRALMARGKQLFANREHIAADAALGRRIWAEL